MTEKYQKGIMIMNYFEGLGLNMLTIGEAIDDKNIEKSYALIRNNPQITKNEFLSIMRIEEWEN